MTSREQLNQALQVELHTVNRVLEPVGIEPDDFKMPAAYARYEADIESNTEMQEALIGDDETVEIKGTLADKVITNKGKVAATARNIHEANRFRRDYNIATASHKQLMLSMYKTMYQRRKKLTNALEAANA